MSYRQEKELTMSEPFLAEIRIVGFDFPPRGWAFCDGQILPINQNQALYSLMGTTYGGDGRTTFALPDLRGRVPIHTSDSRQLGIRSGQETSTLTAAEMPSHTHTIRASADAATGQDPTNRVLARSGQIYSGPTNLVDMVSGTMTNNGGGQAHNNMQPYLNLGFIVALQGLYPLRS
jgi:microcystin-dependent protein